MCVRIIRTVGRGAARPDAHAEQPWLHVAACPHAAARTIGIALCSRIPSFRILRPIQRETIANEPFAEVSAADRADRYAPPVLILGYGCTLDRSPRDEGVEIIGCIRATDRAGTRGLASPRARAAQAGLRRSQARFLRRPRPPPPPWSAFPRDPLRQQRPRTGPARSTASAAEYEADCAHIQRLLEETKVKYRELET
jgi:hypothetical protein